MPGASLEHSSGFKEKHKNKFFEEVLRQKCLFKTLPEHDKNEWFFYMDKFYQKCFISDPTSFKNYNPECSSQIFAEFNDFSVESINDCIKNSFV